MKASVRNIVIIVLLVAIVLTFHIVRRNATMRGIEVRIAPTAPVALLTADDVDSLIVNAFPHLYESDIREVDPRAIKTLLEEHPYVLEADASMSTGGKLMVEVTPRVPVVRMFYQGNEFYISRQGTCMPLAANHYCHVLVGSSDWEEPLLEHPTRLDLADTANHRQPASLMKIWTLASFLHDNERYDEVFDQVYVGNRGDLYLVPKLGSVIVEVGDTTALKDKFENLWAFFDQGINQVGWDTYSSISLKYKGQVVCTRREQQR